MERAAIILCAGNGTRMNDDKKNKVCFNCAGIPVIRRIITNMREGGITHFVIVVGHNAQSVMDCLDGVDGIIYAYQRQQLGTGHAALCGLKALETIGYSGAAIISMGDKIISSRVVSDLLRHAEAAKAVWSVQPISANLNGGRVITEKGKPYGVVEFADAAMMALSDIPQDQWATKLESLGLNSKKAAVVLKKAAQQKPEGLKLLNGKTFTTQEILAIPYANAGLYCLNVQSAISAISACNSSNIQGEIYLTDTLEYFAQRDEVKLYEVTNPDEMLTYSTKPELRKMSEHFMRKASQFISDIENGALDSFFFELYRENSFEQKKRYLNLIKYFILKYGDKNVVLTRAPGRVNLMGRHIDHRGGGINVMTIDRDTVFIASPREDDTINLSNFDTAYPDRSFSIGACLSMAEHNNWLDYLTAEPVTADLKKNAGDWANYVKAAALRFQLSNDMTLCGMDIAAYGNIPVAAGLSSSSSVVVATAEAIVALNSLNITDREFIDLCGEGEWFVGSRGGAGDHAAMKCSQRDRITHLEFKPFKVGVSVPFSNQYAIIVADSMTQAKKSEGSRDIFNAKVATYEFAFMLLKRSYPEYDLREFRDIAKIKPTSKVSKMLLMLPEKATRSQISQMLPEYENRIHQIYANHSDPGEYDLRGVALYGVSECARSEKCIEAFESGNYTLLGQMMKISHDGDRIKQAPVSDEILASLADGNAELYLQPGAYGCSTERIDGLCDLLNRTPGVYGSQIIGAGLGGCVIALVKKEEADKILDIIRHEYYTKNGYEFSANTYLPSSGSAVLF
ncbi:MAG TPA: galactokinase family protein [Oscillospiraceae bacterium]|nr:galactokinase family protein [Oscillospiraceae bacterium]HPS35124.1 galactokinase family protein [Oscillospiraceae bacterium]